MIDHKKRNVQVQQEEEYDYADFASKFQDFQPLVTKDPVEHKSDNQIINELKCGEKRLYKTKGKNYLIHTVWKSVKKVSFCFFGKSRKAQISDAKIQTSEKYEHWKWDIFGAIFNQYHASSIFLSFIHEIFLPDIEDLSVPIVCFPEAAEPHIVQKPGESTALPCIVSF